jgi:hypothetical protein
MKKGGKNNVRKQMTPKTLEGRPSIRWSRGDGEEDGGQERWILDDYRDTHISRGCVSTSLTAGCICARSDEGTAGALNRPARYMVTSPTHALHLHPSFPYG